MTWALKNQGEPIHERAAVGLAKLTEDDSLGVIRLTGLLGAAAWKLGGWSLEEFGTDRHNKRGGPKTSSGRVDLWLALGELSATIEAKIHWPDKTKTDAKHELSRSLNEAKSRLREIPAEFSTDHSFAECYEVPWYRNSDATRGKGKEVLKYLRELARTKGNLAMALHFGSKPDGGDKRLYPGVLLVSKEVPIPKKNRIAPPTRWGRRPKLVSTTSPAISLLQTCAIMRIGEQTRGFMPIGR